MRLRRRLFSHSRLIRGPVPRPCPSWCLIDHETEVDADGERLHASNSLARVSLWASEDLRTGEWSQTIVVGRANNLTGEQARALALEILDAADLLEEVEQ